MLIKNTQTNTQNPQQKKVKVNTIQPHARVILLLHVHEFLSFKTFEEDKTIEVIEDDRTLRI